MQKSFVKSQMFGRKKNIITFLIYTFCACNPLMQKSSFLSEHCKVSLLHLIHASVRVLLIVHGTSEYFRQIFCSQERGIIWRALFLSLAIQEWGKREPPPFHNLVVHLFVPLQKKCCSAQIEPVSLIQMKSICRQLLQRWFFENISVFFSFTGM